MVFFLHRVVSTPNRKNRDPCDSDLPKWCGSKNCLIEVSVYQRFCSNCDTDWWRPRQLWRAELFPSSIVPMFCRTPHFTLGRSPSRWKVLTRWWTTRNKVSSALPARKRTPSPISPPWKNTLPLSMVCPTCLPLPLQRLGGDLEHTLIPGLSTYRQSCRRVNSDQVAMPVRVTLVNHSMAACFVEDQDFRRRWWRSTWKESMGTSFRTVGRIFAFLTAGNYWMHCAIVPLD